MGQADGWGKVMGTLRGMVKRSGRDWKTEGSEVMADLEARECTMAKTDWEERAGPRSIRVRGTIWG